MSSAFVRYRVWNPHLERVFDDRLRIKPSPPRLHEGGWTMALGEAGEARFYRPDGSLMPPVPVAPALPDQPARALAGRHDALGIEIDAWTATPEWEGDRLVTDWALFTLR